jgi:hypothetical protein
MLQIRLCGTSYQLELHNLIFLPELMKTRKILLSLLITLFALVEVSAQWEDQHLLFVINRSKDADEIHYAVNLDASGKIDQQNPISVYWVKHSEGGKQVPLTWIQKRYAYGVGISKTEADEISFYLFSKTDQLFNVRKDNADRYGAFTTLNNMTIRADSLYIQIDGGSFLQPSIAAIHIFGQDIESGISQAMSVLE